MMKSETRRIQLIDEALAQVAKSGWAATTHRSVAEACGVQESLVYQHFPKRSALRTALMHQQPELNLPDEPDLRMDPVDRRRQLLDVGLALAEKVGYRNVTMTALTEAAGVSRTLYHRYFTTVGRFRVDVMRAAVKKENLIVIAQGLAAKDPQAMKASPELRERAAATIAA